MADSLVAADCKQHICCPTSAVEFTSQAFSAFTKLCCDNFVPFAVITLFSDPFSRQTKWFLLILAFSRKKIAVVSVSHSLYPSPPLSLLSPSLYPSLSLSLLSPSLSHSLSPSPPLSLSPLPLPLPLLSPFSVCADYERIFHFLKQIQGSLDTRLIFLQNIIKEAARFGAQPPLHTHL